MEKKFRGYKMKEKKIFYMMLAYTIVIGLVLTAVQISAFTTSTSPEVTAIKVFTDKSPMPQSAQKSEVTIPLVAKQTVLPTDIPVVSTSDDEIHPAITMYGNGLLWGGYTTQLSILEQTIGFIYSGDNGATWVTPSGLNPDIGIIDYISVDSLGNGVVATFQPDPGTSEQWRIIMPDPLDTGTWDGSSWDWSTNFNYVDFKNLEVAGYQFPDTPNAAEYYGWMVGTVSEAHVFDEPTFFFANGETAGSGWIWTWGDPGSHSLNATVDIDDSNGKMYSAWEYSNETTHANDILLATGYLKDYLAADYADWGPDPTWSMLGGEEINKHPDVAASNQHVYVTCEADDAIVCYYSTDNGDTWNLKTVASNGLNPTITASGTKATIAFVSNGNIFAAETQDGGASWSEPAQINEQNDTVDMEYAGAEITSHNHLLWTDTRNGNKDIYYQTVRSASPAAPTITGPASGNAKKAYDYTLVTTDYQGDQVSYYIDWGDGTNSGWVGPSASGEQITQSHTWAAKGNFTIKAKAKDTAVHESDWGTLTVSMPYTITTPFQLLLEKLFERFPYAFPILRHLLG
jgi:hypothetical protein